MLNLDLSLLGISPGGLGSGSRANAFFMEITGAKSGKFKGSSLVKGKEGKIEVFGIESTVESPRDPVTGFPTGRRMHYPLTVVTKLDKATPLLFNALCTNETLTKVLIEVWGAISVQSGIASGTGSKVYYTFELKNANLQQVRQFTLPDGTLFAALSFTWQSILTTWTDGGIVGNDDWLASTL
jgi:type VI secretion system secreted protein Hcp